MDIQEVIDLFGGGDKKKAIMQLYPRFSAYDFNNWKNHGRIPRGAQFEIHVISGYTLNVDDDLLQATIYHKNLKKKGRRTNVKSASIDSSNLNH